MNLPRGKNAPIGTPYYIKWDVSGLTITSAAPLVYQLPQMTVDFDLLQILPGTAILLLPSTPPDTTVFNSVCTLRIYNEILAPFNTQKQGYKPQSLPIHSQQFGTGAPVLWGRGLNLALEIFTPYNLALQAGSIVETTLIPGNFQYSAAEASFAGSRSHSGGPTLGRGGVG